eukprot:GHVU01116615.1.p1 GENE.GHVU01116615.1~~GHVU01116615.1.p1  ORF type:complete len:219 (-),score=18.23 GHVU01116615.1:265-921(-)
MMLSDLKQIVLGMEVEAFKLSHGTPLDQLESQNIQGRVKDWKLKTRRLQNAADKSDETKPILQDEVQAGQKALGLVSEETRFNILHDHIFTGYGLLQLKRTFAIKEEFFTRKLTFRTVEFQFEDREKAKKWTLDLLDVLTTPAVVQAYNKTETAISPWMDIDGLKTIYEQAITYVRDHNESIKRPDNWKDAAKRLMDLLKLEKLILNAANSACANAED